MTILEACFKDESLKADADFYTNRFEDVGHVTNQTQKLKKS